MGMQRGKDTDVEPAERTAVGDEIADFYDDFLDRRMVGYRLRANRRLQLANRFARSHIRRDSHVLDVGCGIGMTSEAVAKKARRGKVWAFDLSRRNVDYARKTVRRDNIAWAAMDVLESPARLRDWVSEPVDVIVLIDVLEHIAIEDQPVLFRALLGVAADDVTVVLTFPSVAYQQHLRANNPGELQPVDEDITATHLEGIAWAHGLDLTFWRSVDVWLTDQYVHAALHRGHPLTPVTLSPGAQALKVADAVRRRTLRPVYRRRYGYPRHQ